MGAHGCQIMPAIEHTLCVTAIKGIRRTERLLDAGILNWQVIEQRT